jgi:hypothetical protein
MKMPTNQIKFEGKEVKDATKKIVIEISRADISAGKSKMPDACAAARACLRQVPKCTQARVFKSRTFLKIGTQWLRYQTPQSMRMEIVAFDRGTNFLPGVYVLSPLQPSHRHGGSARGGKDPVKKRAVKKAGAKVKSRVPYHVMEGVREFSLK